VINTKSSGRNSNGIKNYTQSSRQGEFHPKPLSEPYVNLSIHTALIMPPIFIDIVCSLKIILNKLSCS